MRVRTTGGLVDIGSSPVTTWSTNSPTPIDLGTYFYKYVHSFGVISDVPKRATLKYASGVRRLAMKPVVHLKWDAEGGEEVVTVRTSPNNWQTNTAAHAIQGWFLRSPHGIDKDVGTKCLQYAVDAFPDVDAAFSQHWNDVKPSMATRASLAVFLYELRDLKRMFEILPSKHLSWGAQKKKLKSWRDVLSVVNRGHLNYNFGWKPFIRDVINVKDGLASFEERLKKFLDRAGEELRLHRSPQELVISDTSTTSAPDPNFTLVVTKDFSVKFSSSFELTYSVPQMSPNGMRIRALLDTLGLNLNPSTIWAVIPWSFVVDWFIGIGPALKASENDWLQPWLDYHQGCVTRHCHGTVRVDFRDPYGGAVHTGVTVKFSHFLRKVGMPNNSIRTNPLTADKIRLGGSLLLGLMGYR